MSCLALSFDTLYFFVCIAGIVTSRVETGHGVERSRAELCVAIILLVLL